MFTLPLTPLPSCVVCLHFCIPLFNKKRELKDTFLPFFPPFVIYQTHITQCLRSDTFFITSIPLSLTLSGHFGGVGIIYCEVQRLREWAGAWAFNLSLGILYVTCFTAVCFVQEHLNLSGNKDIVKPLNPDSLCEG